MAADIDLVGFSNGLADLADKVRASLVQVHAGNRGIGSGVVWSVGAPNASGEAEATIITNAHVVMAARGTTLVVQPVGSDEELAATLTAVDPTRDLAALKVTGKGFTAAEIGDSATLRVGELVIAVGNPWGRVGAMTAGVVAARAPVDLEEEAKHADPITPDESRPNESREERPRRGWRFGRRLETEVIQADIRLYPGNSGGPLADARGRVVGINAMVVGGLGFAIPSRAVRQFLAETQRNTQVYLGVQVQTTPVAPAQRDRIGLSGETAALIVGVEAGSPADAAGVLIGDILLAVGSYEITDAASLARIMRRLDTPQGEPLPLRLARAGQPIELTLTPELRVAA
ncbi:MAG TPA: trypsin-like peptidase domain-containing protein [Ktedonobacterales bacterium]